MDGFKKFINEVVIPHVQKLQHPRLKPAFASQLFVTSLDLAAAPDLVAYPDVNVMFEDEVAPFYIHKHIKSTRKIYGMLLYSNIYV